MQSPPCQHRGPCGACSQQWPVPRRRAKTQGNPQRPQGNPQRPPWRHHGPWCNQERRQASCRRGACRSGSRAQTVSRIGRRNGWPRDREQGGTSPTSQRRVVRMPALSLVHAWEHLAHQLWMPGDARHRSLRESALVDRTTAALGRQVGLGLFTVRRSGASAPIRAAWALPSTRGRAERPEPARQPLRNELVALRSASSNAASFSHRTAWVQTCTEARRADVLAARRASPPRLAGNTFGQSSARRCGTAARGLAARMASLPEPPVLASGVCRSSDSALHPAN
jgi:hypothetical protein